MSSNTAKVDVDAEFEQFLNEPLTSSEDTSIAAKITTDNPRVNNDDKPNKWLKRTATVQSSEDDNIADITEDELYNMLSEINSAEISLSTPTVTGLYSADFDDEDGNTDVNFKDLKDDEHISEDDSATIRDEDAIDVVGGLESFQTVILNDNIVVSKNDAQNEESPSKIVDDRNSVEVFLSQPVTRSFDEIMKEVDVLERRSRMSEEISKQEYLLPAKKVDAVGKKTEVVENLGENLHPKTAVTTTVNTELQLQLQEERRRNSKLHAEFIAQEISVKKNLEDLRSAYEEKIFRLEEENIVLSSRLTELNNSKVVQKVSEDANEISAKIQAEKAMKALKDQERILAGCQSENERLYKEVKKLNMEMKEKENYWEDRYKAMESEISNLKKHSSSDKQKLQVANDKNVKMDAVVVKDDEIAKQKEKMAALNEDIEASNAKLSAYRTKITDLEKQVKELKELVATKHPNSIAALMMAASLSNGENETSELDTSANVASSEVQDKWNGLSQLQEEYLQVKEIYEKRIKDLEQKVKELERDNRPHRPHSSFAALEKELESCCKRHEKEVTALKCQIEKLKNEQVHSKLAPKDINSPSKCKVGVERKNLDRDVFEQTDVENRKLLQQVNFLSGRVEDLEMQLENAEKVNKQIYKSREDNESLISNLRVAQQKERQELENELGKWFSKASDQKSQLDLKQVMISQLKEQLLECQKKAIETGELQMEARKLKEERSSLRKQLRETADNVTPEQERMNELRLRLEDLEDKYVRKEDELRKMRGRNLGADDSQLQKEITLWKLKLRDRNKEVDKFRSELDGILKVLEEMKRQGVRVPVTKTMIHFLK